MKSISSLYQSTLSIRMSTYIYLYKYSIKTYKTNFVIKQHVYFMVVISFKFTSSKQSFQIFTSLYIISHLNIIIIISSLSLICLLKQLNFTTFKAYVVSYIQNCKHILCYCMRCHNIVMLLSLLVRTKSFKNSLAFIMDYLLYRLRLLKLDVIKNQ